MADETEENVSMPSATIQNYIKKLLFQLGEYG